ncbi:hypothetical protein MXB_451 [Myxobolus squamalis]|nr:hypothetical protein MXB_451 [Myxobolus squamalis]
MYKLKRVVCSPDSTVSSKKSDKASQKKKKNLTSSPKKEIQPKFTTKGGSKTTEKSAASICTDTGISICCDAHFDNRITKTASIKQKPISIVTEQVILPEEPCKDEITREKWQVDQTNIDEIYKNRHMTSEDIYKILRKYIPESQISTSNIADEANENKPKVSKTTLVDFYEKHICKDCGGVCHEQDTVDCEKDKTKCQTACHFSLSNINEPKPFEVSEGESSKHLESPHSSTLTASADEKTSQIQIPSFKEYCNDLKYSKSSTDPSFSPCVSENSTKHHIASSTESSSKSQEIKKNVFPTLLPSLPTDQDKQSTEISDTIPPPILSESSSAEEKITPSNTKSMDQATPPASTENKDVVSTAVDTNEASTLPKEETQPSIEIPVITITPIPSTSNLETVVPAVSVTSPEATVTATDATLTPMQPIYIPLENPESTITTVETSDTLTTPETTSFHSTEAVATTTDSNATSSPSANVSSTINAVSVPVAETHIVAAETTSTSVSAESTLTPISANTSPDAENLANDVTSPSSVEISPTADSTLLSTDVTTSTGESLGTPDTASLALGNTTSIINANETVIIPESNLTD